MRHPFLKILLSTLLLTFTTSCIKEDRSDCNPGALLKYDYSLNMEHTNLFEKEVHKVSVYVFDEQGFYFDCFTEAGSHLTNSWEMFLPIPPGKYTAVTWGGELDDYRLGETNAEETDFVENLRKGVTHIDNFMLVAEKDNQSLIRLTDLYHGKVDVESTYSPKTATLVPLMKDTKKLVVTVNNQSMGQRAQAEDAFYQVSCMGANARYKADNSFGKKAEKVTYLPGQLHTESGKFVAELNLLRMLIGSPLRLVVQKSDGIKIFDKDLMDVIQSTGHYKTQEDFDREDEYYVEINTNKDLIVNVIINGWVAVEIFPDI